MTRVYGPTIEPGGMELDEDSYTDDCPACGKPANFHVWEAAECGSINVHTRIGCPHCGYYESDAEDE